MYRDLVDTDDDDANDNADDGERKAMVLDDVETEDESDNQDEELPSPESKEKPANQEEISIGLER